MGTVPLSEILKTDVQQAPKASPQWWMPYTEPLPTWTEESKRGYPRALGIFLARPISDDMREQVVQAKTAYLFAGEGSVGISYFSKTGFYYPILSVKMKEKPHIMELAKLTHVPPAHIYYNKEDGTWEWFARGLRAMVLMRIWEIYLPEGTKRKSAFDFLIEKGTVFLWMYETNLCIDLVLGGARSQPELRGRLEFEVIR